MCRPYSSERSRTKISSGARRICRRSLSSWRMKPAAEARALRWTLLRFVAHDADVNLGLLQSDDMRTSRRGESRGETMAFNAAACADFLADFASNAFVTMSGDGHGFLRVRAWERRDPSLRRTLSFGMTILSDRHFASNAFVTMSGDGHTISIRTKSPGPLQQTRTRQLAERAERQHFELWSTRFGRASFRPPRKRLAATARRARHYSKA